MKVTDLKKREYLNHQFNFRISGNQKEQLETLSEDYGLSTSFIVRTALNDWLNTNDNE
jgi:predicted DNA-binding protein